MTRQWPSSRPVHASPSSPAVVPGTVPAPRPCHSRTPFRLGVLAVVVAVTHTPDVLDAEHRPRDVPPPLPPQGPAPGHRVGPPRRGGRRPGCDVDLGAAVFGLVQSLFFILLHLHLHLVGPSARRLPLLLVLGVRTIGFWWGGVASVKVLRGRRDVMQLPLLLDVGLRVTAQHGREGEQHLQEDGDIDDDERQTQEGDAHCDEARHGGAQGTDDTGAVLFCFDIQIFAPGQIKGEEGSCPF